jgi:hypothetical protein
MLNYMMLGKLFNSKMQTELTPQEEPTIDDLFMMAIEEHAAELEITVDYYMAEFM